MWKVLLLTVTIITIVRSEYSYKFEKKWFTVPLDHFGYQRNETFKIKYLENEDHWDTAGGPIFFYTGNEGQIELFANHTGFMWDIADEYKAKLVFAEHRYYGASQPFGDRSLDNEHIGYLTSSQALADYADLINYLQGGSVVPKYPVIAFGGSYGGMLAAYIRMKYPHLVAGAIAASAPIHMYPGMVPCDTFNRIVTSSFTQADEKCSENIRKSWQVIRNFTTTANSTAWLKQNWRFCDGVHNKSDADQLVDFLSSMYTTIAMVNYPFSSDFLMPLPAYPVRVVCQYLNESLDGVKLLEGIGKIIEIYTNYNHKNNDCVDYRVGDDYGNLNASGWDYQACTEMIMPICSTGASDMFEPRAWNFTEYAEECHQRFRVRPRESDARVTYGGALLQAASNIVFSNGLLDPWAVGGILNSVSESVQAVLISNAAHHLDLMASNEADPIPVTMARATHKQHIDKWIRDFSVKISSLSRKTWD